MSSFACSTPSCLQANVHGTLTCAGSWPASPPFVFSVPNSYLIGPRPTRGGSAREGQCSVILLCERPQRQAEPHKPKPIVVAGIQFSEVTELWVQGISLWVSPNKGSPTVVGFLLVSLFEPPQKGTLENRHTPFFFSCQLSFHSRFMFCISVLGKSAVGCTCSIRPKWRQADLGPAGYLGRIRTKVRGLFDVVIPFRAHKP